MVSIKGTVVLDTIADIRSEGGEAELAQILSRLEGKAQAFFRDEIEGLQPMRWVPLDHYTALLEACHAIYGSAYPDMLISRTEQIVEQQSRGIYRVMMKLSRPEALATRSALIIQTYYQGIEVESTIQGKGRVLHVYRGFEKRHRLIAWPIMGFFRKALQICGVRGIETKFITPIEDGLGHADLLVTWI